MSILEYIFEDIKKIQSSLLLFLEEESNTEDNFANLQHLLIKQKIQADEHKLSSFLYLLVKIVDNHHRGPNFFDKVFQILEILKPDIKRYYSNSQIFHFFKDNKRVLLFLIEEQMMQLDQNIILDMFATHHKEQYIRYFLPELKPYFHEKWFPQYYFSFDYETISFSEIEKEEIPEDFYENRKSGEKESYLCKLIQKDSVEEFIKYVHLKNIQFDSEILPSIFETNRFLLEKEKERINLLSNQRSKEPTLIEYAAFYGSIQIFRYLVQNKVELTQSVWFYSIHGHNPEMIHFLEENKGDLDQEQNFFNQLLTESIKCHHNDFTRYINDSLLSQNDEKLQSDNILQLIDSFNFEFIKSDQLVASNTFNAFVYACKYDNYFIAKFILDSQNIQNTRTIFNVNKVFIEIIQCNSKKNQFN